MAPSIKSEIKRFKKDIEKYDFGMIGNKILYDMCKKYPYHKDESEIIAKVWLIGRSYATSIERNRNNKNVSDDFYSDIVAPQFKENNAFDNLLLRVRNLDGLNENKISIVLETHKRITNFIRKITRDDKRSFVSKYLHFHFPGLFFIYDSRVAGVINSVFRRIGCSQKDVDRFVRQLTEYDEAYAKFFIKCFYFWKFCKLGGMLLNLRQIDSFLIEKANKKIRSKKPKN